MPDRRLAIPYNGGVAARGVFLALPSRPNYDGLTPLFANILEDIIMLIYHRPGDNRRNRYFGILLLTILSASTAFAADQKAAVTDINQVDSDFALTGEFVGTVTANPKRPNKVRPISLQIRATGGATFEAMQYLAGLPGSRKRTSAWLPAMDLS